MSTHRIVSTKLLSSDLVDQLSLAGIGLWQYEFIKTILQLPPSLDLSGLQKNIVLTSKPAVQAWAAIATHFHIEMAAHRVYCIDQATKKEVLAHGLIVAGEARDAASLADVILNDPSIKSVTYVCSSIRRDELPSRLKAGGVEVHEVVGYHTQATPVKITGAYEGVLFFSPSGVDSFLSQNEMAPVCFCIGDATAAHALTRGFTRALVSDVSTPESIVKKVIQYYSKNPVHA